MRSAIAILIVGSVIATLGAAAIVVHAFRRRSRERFLPWFGLFPIFYGIVLIIRNEVFRLGFGDPGQVGVSIERLITMATAVPGLLLFEEFYGPGWRSSIWWLLAAYSAFSAAAIVGMVSAHHFRLIFPPGVMLVITVPTILVVGRLAGYKPHASAAHPPGLVWRRGRQELEKLDGEGLLLGVRPNECYAAREVSFETGDRLLLYSDGLVEAENGDGESFGDAALPAFIQEKQNLGTEQFADLLLGSVLDWSRSGSGKGQEDDITILVVDMQDDGEAAPIAA